MEQLIEQYATPPVTPAEGEIFDGRVIAVNDTGVVVDVGGKFEGLVPAQEFLETGGAIPFGPGQTIEVERLHEHKDGYVLLSHVRAHRRRIWENVEKSYREEKTITGKVIERITGLWWMWACARSCRHRRSSCGPCTISKYGKTAKSNCAS
jgi:ribosomal protein S1